MHNLHVPMSYTKFRKFNGPIDDVKKWVKRASSIGWWLNHENLLNTYIRKEGVLEDPNIAGFNPLEITYKLQSTSPNISRPSLQSTSPIMSRPSLQSTSPIMSRPSLQSMSPIMSRPNLQSMRPIMSRPNLQSMGPIMSRPSLQTMSPVMSRPNLQSMSPGRSRPSLKSTFRRQFPSWLIDETYG